jgi:hypothetical protein
MSKPANHRYFEAAIADMLGRAYEAFPAPLHFDFGELYEEAMREGKIPPDCPRNFDPYHSLYGSSLAFLHREGVVHVHDEVSAFGADGVVLTSKGFIILNKPLESIEVEGKTTLGEELTKAGRKTGTDFLSAVISQTIGYLVSSMGGN